MYKKESNVKLICSVHNTAPSLRKVDSINDFEAF